MSIVEQLIQILFVGEGDWRSIDVVFKSFCNGVTS